jgi:hypothetical protein
VHNARLLNDAMAAPAKGPERGELVEGRTLVRGTVVHVPKPGAQRSYVYAHGLRALVDNDQLEWPTPPSAWERLVSPEGEL